jgi:3-oxoacyl-[acyl-carrier protein] reductase
MLLNGKTTIVTGASRGIGRCIAETFASHGSNIFACVRKLTPDLKKWAEEIEISNSVKVYLLKLDLTDFENSKNLVKQVLEISPRVDVLVNNAGIASGSLFQMTTTVNLKEIFEVNFFNQIHLTQGISRLMQRGKAGSIINIGSTAAFIPDSGTLAYGASKAALTRAAQSMAVELGSSNIRVNTIAPGVTMTDMFDQMNSMARDKLISSSALKRAATPQDIANAALFLASDLSAFITGQTIRVDGGIV